MGRGVDSRNRFWNWEAKLHGLVGRYDNPMPTWFLAPIAGLKGTLEWEFFWLRFWILSYFIVTYAKMIRFWGKNFLIGPLWRELRLFRVVLRLRGMKKIFWARSKKYFIFFPFMNPLHEPILVFPKFDPLTAPGMALCVNLGPNCQN